MKHLIPPNEQERLAALRNYRILDTPPEEVFDRITTLAARIFQVPIATMSLVDERRQWFKSCVGLDTTETPRELAFCSHAVLADEVFVVPDARADPRFADNALVIGEPFIRFYAGAPLIVSPGVNLGTLCLIDRKPREFSENDCQTLADLAAVLMDEVRFRQAAGDLRQNEAKFRALTENAQDIITVLSPKGVIEFQSPSITRVLGYDTAEMVGLDAFGFVHPKDVEETAKHFQEAIAGGTPPPMQFRFRHKDGSYRWLEAITSGNAHDPIVGGVVVNSRDITQRRVADERLRLFESVAVNANDAILVTEAEPVELPGPRILYVNEAFTRMTGYTPEDVLGRTPRILQGPKTSQSELDRIRVALKAWKPVVVELVNYHKDGSEFWVELSIVPVADSSGWYTHWVSVQRDVTRRRLTQEALQAAKEEADRANRAKSEFLSRMSHELRTPLNAILGFAQLLEPDPNNKDDQESVEQIAKAGRHLLDLINEVLDIARIEAGRIALSIEAVSLDEAMREALDTVRPLAAARGISLHGSDCGRFILADRQRLKQIFLNLISNAIKYNCTGGTVRVECEEREGANGQEEAVPMVRICVRDTGAGISAPDLARLFVPFERLDTGSQEIEGIGLGLAVSKRLIELMGGAIGVESVPGEGSNFWIELPEIDDPMVQIAKSAPTAVNEAADPGVVTILYVEDNVSNLRLVERILARRPNVTLLAAMHGEQALELAQQRRPDLILLDLHLPGMGGSEVLARLRADERTTQIPVIVISADATPSQIARLKDAGANGYLTKPIEVEKFSRTVERILRRNPTDAA